mgnify:CR=1 FL=1|tara:strand:- start:14713 stop:15318 length:606 start_codon:yes stop_codon:yes gene_type:complete
MKKIYCIRHGLALHNVLFKVIGNHAYSEKYIDTPLVDEGICQAERLGLKWKEKNNIQIVFVSPLTRTIETALNIFKDIKVKIVAVEEIIEFSQGKEYCNLRKNKSVLKEKYPMIDFSLIEETPKYWNTERRETLEELNFRDGIFKKILCERNEKKIAIVSHSTYLKQFLFNYVDSVDESKQLKHCYPYEKNLLAEKVTKSI